MFQNTAFAFVVRVLSRDRLMRPRLPELKAVLRYEEEGQIVDWDGDDPENPKNWPFRYKVPFLPGVHDDHVRVHGE